MVEQLREPEDPRPEAALRVAERPSDLQVGVSPLDLPVHVLPRVFELGRACLRQLWMGGFKRTDKPQDVLPDLRPVGLKERSFHALRHFLVSELMKGGASAEAVRVLAGHASLAMTQRYAHAAPADLRAAIDRLGR